MRRQKYRETEAQTAQRTRAEAENLRATQDNLHLRTTYRQNTGISVATGSVKNTYRRGNSRLRMTYRA